MRATVVDAFSLNYRVTLARGRLLRPQRGPPRRQLVRHARQIRRCDLNGRGPLVFQSAASRSFQTRAFVEVPTSLRTEIR